MEKNELFILNRKCRASELVSFLDNRPTELNLQALEDSKLPVINQKNWVYAVTQISGFTMAFIRAQQDTNYMLKKRLAEATVETPEEKYVRFIKEEPLLLQRLPLYHIASYLAMTPETLSRIRKKILQNNFLSQIKFFVVSCK